MNCLQSDELMKAMELGDIFLVTAVVVSIAACGDRIPESDGAKKLGAAPKQIVDKASSDIGKALEQGAHQSREAEEGKK
jgi:hypothetical protein